MNHNKLDTASTMTLKLMIAFMLIGSAVAGAQTTLPIAPNVVERHVTSKDLGPDLDPVKFASTKFNSLKLGGTFDSFTSSSYALANVWVYAAGDDKTVYNSKFEWTYPEFYQPTWGEVFDRVARQIKCRWSWDAHNRQFKFEPSRDEPLFGVTLADGWRREDRGAYVWHAPKDQDFGMDIYDYGQFTIPKGDAELPKKIREYYAVMNISNWPTPPTVDQMSMMKAGEYDALYLKTDTPRPGGVWRQWSLLVDGHAYLIVSAMPKDREAKLAPAIDKMVQTFTVKSPATKPAR